MGLAFLSDLIGTMQGYFKVGGTSGVRLKNSSGNLLVRNTGDSADAEATVSKLSVSGNTVDINSDAAGSGADWKYTLTRPAAGMSAAVTLTLPVDDGTASQVLSTDGNGTLSWVSAASTAASVTKDTTSLNFNSGATVAMFTLPANAVVHEVRVIVDTAFDAGTMSVGISGTVSKYAGTTDIDLTAAAETSFIVHPSKMAAGGTEALIITYTAGGATVGAARVEISYSVPA